MKKVMAISLSILTIFMFCSCGSNKTTIGKNDKNETKTVQINEATTEDIAESTAELTSYEDLMEENNCVLLCYGTGKDNSKYYLVANQTESYDSVQIKVGVIKNNEWLIPLTTDSPFLEGDKNNNHLVTRKNLDYSRDYFTDYSSAYANKDIEPYEIRYVAEGCFGCDYSYYSTHTTIIYNVNNNKVFRMESASPGSVDFDGIVKFFFIENKDYAHTDKIVFSKTLDGQGGYIEQFSILDTETMNTNIIVSKTEYDIMGPYSDGLFAVGKDYGNELLYFYDSNGEKVVDVTQFNEKGYIYELPYFIDGKFSYKLCNSAGTPYRVIINKSCEIIENEEISAKEFEGKN